MLLDIPAVASTEGVVTSVTWRSDRTYAYALEWRIPGSFVSGTFVDNEDVTQAVVAGYATQDGAVIKGAGQTSPGTYLTVDDSAGAANAIGNWVGAGGAIFKPSGLPAFPPYFFVHVAPPNALPAYVLPQTAQSYTAGNSRQLLLNASVRAPQGSTLKFLTCVAPTFHIPVWARSGTLLNRSGADLYIRTYRPNVEANVIDTASKTFGEAAIVGQIVTDGNYYSFDPGGFSPGSAWMLCGALAATGGAIVEFNG